MNHTPLALELFAGHHAALLLQIEARQSSSSYHEDEELSRAFNDLQSWATTAGRPSVYTPQSLASARLLRAVANDYQQKNGLALLQSDAEHQARIAQEILSTGLAEKMIKAGTAGRKLGLLELSARLMPALTFTGSSSYFEVGLVPYGKESRQVLGENVTAQFVSAASALESAENLFRSFKVHYALAETSAAPREEVPKSGKKPEIYFCGLVAGNKKLEQHQIVDTPFRSEFNALVRELMSQALQEMYAHEP